jgi:hypothetical protein
MLNHRSLAVADRHRELEARLHRYQNQPKATSDHAGAPPGHRGSHPRSSWCFFIQHTAGVQTRAVLLKVDELIRATDVARNVIATE